MRGTDLDRSARAANGNALEGRIQLRQRQVGRDWQVALKSQIGQSEGGEHLTPQLHRV